MNMCMHALGAKGCRTPDLLQLYGTQAERKCETMIRKITGPVFHRPDIGTAAVLDKRVAHMQQVGSLIP